MFCFFFTFVGHFLGPTIFCQFLLYFARFRLVVNGFRAFFWVWHWVFTGFSQILSVARLAIHATVSARIIDFMVS